MAPWYTRLIYNLARGPLKTEGYVAAAQVVGASPYRIISGEILPNCFGTIITKMTLDMGFVILLGSGLSFLGLGAQPPTPDLGTMVAEGTLFLPDLWWTSGVFGALRFSSSCSASTFWGTACATCSGVEGVETWPLLEIEDLCVEFSVFEGLSRVVEGVALSVRRGEKVAIVGESGCGKSVTARVILGLLRDRATSPFAAASASMARKSWPIPSGNGGACGGGASR